MLGYFIGVQDGDAFEVAVAVKSFDLCGGESPGVSHRAGMEAQVAFHGPQLLVVGCGFESVVDIRHGISLLAAVLPGI